MSALRAFVALGQQPLVAGTLLTTVGERIASRNPALSGSHILLRATDDGKRATLRVMSANPLAARVAYSFTVPLDSVLAFTGRQYARSPSNLIGQFFKFMLTKYGKPQLFDPSKNYDSLFIGLAKKYVAKYPFHLDEDGLYDMIMDVLHQVVTPATIQAADPSRDSISYFGGMFSMRVKTWLVNENARRKKQQWKPGGDERTDDEWMDANTKPGQTEHDLDYNDLLKDLTAFLGKQPEAKYFLPIFKGYLEGRSSQEMGTQLKVSPTAVSRYTQRLKEAIIKYAQQSDNKDLLTMMQSMLKQRKHDFAPQGFGDDGPDFKKTFDQLKKKLSTAPKTADGEEVQQREPAGDITAIRIKATPDVLTDAYLAKLVLSDRVTPSTIDSSAAEFMGLLNAADDVVEDGNRIFALSVDSSELRLLKQK